MQDGDAEGATGTMRADGGLSGEAFPALAARFTLPFPAWAGGWAAVRLAARGGPPARTTAGSGGPVVPEDRVMRLADFRRVPAAPAAARAAPSPSPARNAEARRAPAPCAAPVRPVAHPGRVLLKIAAVVAVGVAWGLFYLAMKSLLASDGRQAAARPPESAAFPRENRSAPSVAAGDDPML